LFRRLSKAGGRSSAHASRPEQAHANAAASGVELSADTLAAIDKALDGVIIKGSQLGPFANTGVTQPGSAKSASQLISPRWPSRHSTIGTEVVNHP